MRPPAPHSSYTLCFFGFLVYITFERALPFEWNDLLTSAANISFTTMLLNFVTKLLWSWRILPVYSLSVYWAGCFWLSLRWRKLLISPNLSTVMIRSYHQPVVGTDTAHTGIGTSTIDTWAFLSYAWRWTAPTLKRSGWTAYLYLNTKDTSCFARQCVRADLGQKLTKVGPLSSDGFSGIPIKNWRWR